MEKKTIETFIKKYNLNGLIEKVRWNIKDNTLSVAAITDDKKFLASVTQKKFDSAENVVIGIIDSSKIKQMLGALLGDTVNVDLDKDESDADRVLSLVFSDDKIEINCQAADLDVVGKGASVKSIPAFDVEIALTEEFIESFLKAKAALPEADLFTLMINKRKQNLELVLGYNKNNSNRISVAIPKSTGVVKAPISFSARNLKAILDANSECKDAVLKVSEAGMAYVEFDQDGFQSQYYMVKIDVED